MTSVCEEEGMAFEERCRMAVQHLQADLRFFETTAVHSFEYVQGGVERKQRFLTSVQSLPEAERKKLETLAESFDFAKEWIASEANFNKGMWELSLAFSREFFGSDATEFALAQIAKEHPGH